MNEGEEQLSVTHAGLLGKPQAQLSMSSCMQGSNQQPSNAWSNAMHQVTLLDPGLACWLTLLDMLLVAM